MPFIISKVNVSISAEQEIQLKKFLGKAIELIPGKNENYLTLIGEKSPTSTSGGMNRHFLLTV